MSRAFDRLEDALAVLAAALLVFALVFVTLDVASRYFFNRPLSWVFEVTEYILLFVPCLGMAWLARHDGHVMIDVLTSRLPLRRRARLARVVAAVVAFVCAFIAWWGAIATYESWRSHAIIENILETPQYLVYAAIPLGFALCAVEFARKALRRA
ncbi:MAG TPA: TRAP transporter small permease [Burkholderiales bacterium]